MVCLQRTCLISIVFLMAAALADTPVFTTKAGAIRGYDPVAYFTGSEPVEGSVDYTYDWNGATWSFASVINRDAFAADPKRYAPQYGGYCAYAMSKGELASVDPEAWRIVDEKLYLNYSKRIQRRWSQDIPGYVGKADAQWTKKYSQAM